MVLLNKKSQPNHFTSWYENVQCKQITKDDQMFLFSF